mmetsp:Transcript_16518/g.35726  ORF Transcript_16518/g.35726 Transcript_16518/m.35726 type:complete len:230 (-) Transcript_16518:301-990(-)|eukprot:CAMPEP_0202900722 /NCGR_PEP_ID=MMETSP1392-20130828/12003_1 /ASSEMBLY_ACC=CAM_ASM_000868 /TAXON_ID=225041 /ORGANISM="Chlamydomonas chlamydogama, Strain SAG 11-48b" /LENGTH=229 /DNA_ID=CAMNT_0049587163 /DNA_START=155 /DNA_END=844 /DNA_ORIENTATION=-
MFKKASKALPTSLPPLKVPENKKEWQRVALWSFWALNTLIDIIYMGMSFATSSRLSRHVGESTFGIASDAWRAPIAASTLGALMVLVFNIMSCVILIRKSINKSGPGFGYGFIMAWSFVMAFYCLLCGLVLDSFTTNVDFVTDQHELNNSTGWTSYYTQIYNGTIILAYICAGMFTIFFLCLVIFQGGITKTIGMYDAATDEKRKLELAAIAKHAQQSNMNPLAAQATL